MSADSPDRAPQTPSPAGELPSAQETISRREALKRLAASAGAITTMSVILPVQWMDPTVVAGTPTPHAIASLLTPSPSETETYTATQPPTDTPVTAPEGPTPTPPPTPTQPNPNAIPTQPTDTPTSASAAGAQSWGSSTASANQFYWGGSSCGPEDVKFQVTVANPSQVIGVVLFFHLKDKNGSGSTAWNNGVAMSPNGPGAYAYDLFSKDIPGFNTYQDALLIYQFALEGSGGKVLQRSQESSDVELKICRGVVGGAPGFAGPTP